jgi:hypothetical protein
MDSFSSNYIKPRTSNLTNMNASLITNKRQAQMIFTGYSRQIEAINQGFKTQRGGIVFNGDDGRTVQNLKEGAIWTNPETLNGILKTQYNTQPVITPSTYEVQCSDVVGIQYFTIDIIKPFYISVPTPNIGVIQLFFYNSNGVDVVGTQIIETANLSLITPPSNTASNNIGYVFRCTPIIITPSSGISGALEPGYPYIFENNTNIDYVLCVTGNIVFCTFLTFGESYNPTPSWGFTSYIFNPL